MDAKHCEKSPDCCHPWDDSCSCDCNGCDPVRTCPDCGDRFRSHGGHGASACLHTLRTRLTDAEAERDRYRSALRDVAREWPYLDLIDPQTAQECDLRGLVEYLLGAVRSEQRVAREALEGHTDA